MAVRNPDVTYPFRQESNFFYLTGFEEPESISLFDPQHKAPYQLFVQPRDKTKELWEGKIVGPAAAKSVYKADAAFPSHPEQHFTDALIESLQNADRIYYRVGLDPDWDHKLFSIMRVAARRMGRTGRPLWPIHDPNEVLGEMRLFKSRAEVSRMEEAGKISAEAHSEAMRMAKPGMFEFEVEAILHHAFRIKGAQRVGYGSIVASGPNACVLHYVSNNRKMQANDLLLVDAGAEFDYYSADITRVFPVGGVFTQPQREIYSAVLRAQKECISLVRPGRTLRELHLHAVQVLVEELKRLKVLKGNSKQLIEKRAYAPYYPHNTSHWLGMDVHDVGKYYNGSYQNYRKLEAGQVFTIEPGLYFAPEGPGPARYKGIGVRIEDDLVVTQSGYKVLTSGVPKEVEEVESLCNSF